MARRGRRKKARVAALHVDMVRIDAERVDVIRGHDGALRGAPDLVFVCAVYDVEHLVARGLLRVGAPSPYPSRIVPAASEIVRVRVSRKGDRGTLTLLLLAIEEDGGTDVQTIYDALSDPSRWALWPHDTVEPIPIALLHGVGPLASEPRPVHLLLDGLDLRDVCRADDWVSATGARIDVGSGARRLDWIARFVSEDGKNCWSVDVEVRVS